MQTKAHQVCLGCWRRLAKPRPKPRQLFRKGLQDHCAVNWDFLPFKMKMIANLRFSGSPTMLPAPLSGPLGFHPQVVSRSEPLVAEELR
mmetsp:Transcript_84405/g.103444  ORF Transcript_84405/g.103444 Transcript_84405/m.103444 type:complete len:89 (+) Transcript_84405:1-267(+)